MRCLQERQARTPTCDGSCFLRYFRCAKRVVIGRIMSSHPCDSNVRPIGQRSIASRDKGQIVAELNRPEVYWSRVYVSTIAIACPSATTSSSFTRIDLIFPVVVEATGISIFMASTNATSSPSPILPPTSTGSAHTRPATSVTILISGIPLPVTVYGEWTSRAAFCCGRRLPEVACSASGILFRTAEWEPCHGTALGTAKQAGNARQRSLRRGRRYSGGVARVRRTAMLRGTRGAPRQSRNIQSLRAAAIDGVAADAHADAHGPARVSAARSKVSHRPERGGDEHLDDEGPAASQFDPAAAAGCRGTSAWHRRLCHPGSLPTRLSRIRPCGERARSAREHRQPHCDGQHGGGLCLHGGTRCRCRRRAGHGDGAGDAGSGKA